MILKNTSMFLKNVYFKSTFYQTPHKLYDTIFKNLIQIYFQILYKYLKIVQ